MKKFTDQEIENAWEAAPKKIQNMLGTVDAVLVTVAVITSIGTKYKLHIDQIGTLAELNRNMMLGLIDPKQFAQELASLKIPETQVKEIMDEINQKIFVPLQKQMREEASAPPVTSPTPSRIVRTMSPAVQGANPVRNPISNGANAPMPSYAPPPPVPRPALLPPPPPMIIPTASSSVQNLASSLHDVIREVTAKASVPMPSVPAPLPPKLAMPNSVPLIRPGHPTNLLAEKRSVAPAPIPENLSGAMGNAGWPSSPLNRAASDAARSGEPPKAVLATPRPPAMPYSDDPYREPVN